MSRNRAVWLWVLRITLAGLFGWAAIPKLIDPGQFAAAIDNYRAVPEALAGHVALFVPVLELVIAIALLVPAYHRGGACLAALLLVGFAGAMAQARWRGIDLTCGCFGATLEAKVSWVTVARTLGLGVLSGLVLLPSPGRPEVSSGARASNPNTP